MIILPKVFKRTLPSRNTNLLLSCSRDSTRLAHIDGTSVPTSNRLHFPHLPPSLEWRPLGPPDSDTTQFNLLRLIHSDPQIRYIPDQLREPSQGEDGPTRHEVGRSTESDNSRASDLERVLWSLHGRSLGFYQEFDRRGCPLPPPFFCLLTFSAPPGTINIDDPSSRSRQYIPIASSGSPSSNRTPTGVFKGYRSESSYTGMTPGSLITATVTRNRLVGHPSNDGYETLLSWSVLNRLFFHI